MKNFSWSPKVFNPAHLTWQSSRASSKLAEEILLWKTNSETGETYQIMHRKTEKPQKSKGQRTDRDRNLLFKKISFSEKRNLFLRRKLLFFDTS